MEQIINRSNLTGTQSTERGNLAKANIESKILKLKGEHPKARWKEVRRISDMSTRTGDLLSKIKADEVEGLPAIDIANVTSKAFLGNP